MSKRRLRTRGPDEFIPDYETMMRMLVREGKPFKECALAVGYKASVAASGLKRLLRDSGPAAEAYEREIRRFGGLHDLKPLAIRRLHAEIVDYTSPLGMKAIELAGRFKENDWFIRNAEVQVGVLMALGEAGPSIDAVATEIPEESS